LAQYGIQQYGLHSLLIGGRDREIFGESLRKGDLNSVRELVEKFRYDDLSAAIVKARDLLPFEGTQYDVVKYLGAPLLARLSTRC
jgi:hypothetical protein